MGRDQNTFAKRQRELEQKRKAEDKRQKRAGTKPTVAPAHASALSAREQQCLAIFRKYMIVQEGQMLCFHGPELELLKNYLIMLTRKGLLNAESSKGGYSLTATGVAAMKSF